MTNIEMLRAAANVHNRIVRIPVAGDDTILMGDAIRELRGLVAELEKAEKSGEEKAEREGTEDVRS